MPKTLATKGQKDEVWIVGASKGLGLAMAKLYRKQGARVVGMSRTPCPEADMDAFDHYVTIDLQDEAHIDQTIRTLYQNGGLPQTIFCCAVIVHQGSILDRSEGQLRAEVETNYLGFVRLSRAIARFKQERQRVRLVAVGSTLGYVGCPSTDNYSATKAALFSYARSSRVELEPLGIEVLILSPPHMKHAADNGVDLVGPQPYRGEWAAKRMIDAARKGRREYLLGASNRFMMRLGRFAPGAAQAIMNSIGHGALKRLAVRAQLLDAE
jgi:NAD(P)-dependent dehydrogenase (short-subunit alcohol dehydrogenase family)